MKKAFFVLYYVVIVVIVYSALFMYMKTKEAYGIICSADLIAIASKSVYFIYELSAMALVYIIITPYLRPVVVVTFKRRDKYVITLVLKCFKAIFLLATSIFLICAIMSLIFAQAKNCNWSDADSYMYRMYGNLLVYDFSLIQVFLIYYASFILLGFSVGILYLCFAILINRLTAFSSFMFLYVADKYLADKFPLAITRAVIHTYDLYMVGFEYEKWFFYIWWIAIIVFITGVMYRFKNLLTF